MFGQKVILTCRPILLNQENSRLANTCFAFSGNLKIVYRKCDKSTTLANKGILNQPMKNQTSAQKRKKEKDKNRPRGHKSNLSWYHEPCIPEFQTHSCLSQTPVQKEKDGKPQMSKSRKHRSTFGVKLIMASASSCR